VSHEATAWAWKVRGLTKVQRLVLLRLADRARKGTGRAWPGIPKLADDCELSESATRQAVHDLEAYKALAIEEQSRGGRASVYVVPIHNPPPAGGLSQPEPTGSRGVNPPAERARPTGSRWVTHRRAVGNQERTRKNQEGAPDPAAAARGGRTGANGNPAVAAEADAVGRAEAARARARAKASSCPRCDEHGWLTHDDGSVSRCDHRPERKTT
jgi:hypothetical protein